MWRSYAGPLTWANQQPATAVDNADYPSWMLKSLALPAVRRRLLGTVALAALALAACGEDEPSAKADDGGEELENVVQVDGTEADVTVLDNTFNDENIQIAPGTKVIWTNDGRQDHDIVPAEGGQDWGIEPGEFQPEAIYEHTFEEPGTYRYFCSLHGTEDAGMVGAIVVE